MFFKLKFCGLGQEEDEKAKKVSKVNGHICQGE